MNDAAAVMAEAVELAVTVLEPEGDGTFGGGVAAATAMGWQAFELAGAAIVAIAVAEGLACDQLIDVCHGVLPSRVTDGQR